MASDELLYDERVASAFALRETDPVRSFFEFEELAEDGSTLALVYLGSAFEYGLGTTSNLKRAKLCYLKAILGGSIVGAAALGQLCLRQNDYKEAEKYFLIAAERDHPPGVYFLARLYLFGPKEYRDRNSGLILLEKAIVLGHLFAKVDLSSCLLQGSSGVSGFFRGIQLRCSAFYEAMKIFVKDPRDIRLNRFGVY
jgi:TPR repeat protein